MPRIHSFRRRIFLAILAVALVPAGIGLAGGTLLLREIGSSTGTGPWDAVASSGRALIDAAEHAAPADTAVLQAARAHGDALSLSVRQSQLYSVLTERIVSLLPAAALLGAAILAALAAWTAGRLSSSFAGPIGELVGWTGRISRGEALPPDTGRRGGAVEFDALRQALRTMAAELAVAREREVEGARLRAWTEMARRVSHELKNPLTPMRMSAATLARSADPAIRDSAQILMEEIARLDEMARTFAQFGRLPEGPSAPVDLIELAESVVRRHDGNPVPVRLRAGASVPEVQGHLDMLTRALRNLVVNAQEAVQESGGTGVEVEVDAVPDGVRVAVLDDGAGIPTELVERVWLPDVTTKRRGTGLGLPLVRQAVEAHGGSVHASNRPEGGACFVLILPVGVDGEAPRAHAG